MRRVRELIAEIVRAHPNDSFFDRFDESCATNPAKRKAYRTYDDPLRLLDSDSWKILKGKAVAHFRDHRRGQHKQGFFNQLNEAFAYRHLVRQGFTAVPFTPTADESFEAVVPLTPAAVPVVAPCEPETPTPVSDLPLTPVPAVEVPCTPMPAVPCTPMPSNVFVFVLRIVAVLNRPLVSWRGLETAIVGVDGVPPTAMEPSPAVTLLTGPAGLALSGNASLFAT